MNGLVLHPPWSPVTVTTAKSDSVFDLSRQPHAALVTDDLHATTVPLEPAQVVQTDLDPDRPSLDGVPCLRIRPEMHDLLPGTRVVLAQQEKQVARPGHVERRLIRRLLVGDDLDLLCPDPILAQCSPQHFRHFEVIASTRVAVPVTDVMLKVARSNTPDLQDILVTAVAWNRQRNDLRALGSQPVHQAAHRLH